MNRTRRNFWSLTLALIAAGGAGGARAQSPYAEPVPIDGWGHAPPPVYVEGPPPPIIEGTMVPGYAPIEGQWAEPLPGYKYHNQHTHERAGYPLELGHFASHALTAEYITYYVGGGSLKPPPDVPEELTNHHRDRKAVISGSNIPGIIGQPGTFGLDFRGQTKYPRFVFLYNSINRKRKGGYGEYRTDGPHVPDIFAMKLFKVHEVEEGEGEGGEHGQGHGEAGHAHNHAETGHGHVHGFAEGGAPVHMTNAGPAPTPIPVAAMTPTPYAAPARAYPRPTPVPAPAAIASLATPAPAPVASIPRPQLRFPTQAEPLPPSEGSGSVVTRAKPAPPPITIGPASANGAKPAQVRDSLIRAISVPGWKRPQTPQTDR